MSWGDLEATDAKQPFRVTNWRKDEGPLANAADGTELAVAALQFRQRQAILGEGSTLASFTDGKPFLLRHAAGRGAVYFCATLPAREWSNFGDGTVLVPMLQRLLAAGGQRLGTAANVFCGEAPADAKRIDQTEPTNPRAIAGIYQAGNRVFAVNRPASEDEPDVLDESVVRSLFGAIPLTLLEQPTGDTGKLESELWRALIVLMLVFLIAEAFLAMPERTQEKVGAASAPRPAKSEAMAEVH